MNIVNSIFLLTPEQLFICLKNCSFGPSHHRLRSHVMFISMQHLLLGFGWEVDGVILNAMLVFTLADLHFLFAICKPHPPSNRMLISPFLREHQLLNIFLISLYFTGTQRWSYTEGLCRSSQLNNLELLSCLPKFTPHLTQHSLSVFFEQVLNYRFSRSMVLSFLSVYNRTASASSCTLS